MSKIKVMYCKQCKVAVEETVESLKTHYPHGVDIFWCDHHDRDWETKIE